MLSRFLTRLAVALALAGSSSPMAMAQNSKSLSLAAALQRAASANPRLVAADRDIGIASGRSFQAGAIPNPEVSLSLDNSLGSGQYRGLRSAETTLQLSQLIELGGKRDARLAAGSAEVEAAYWQRQAVRLEILSETAIAFYNVLTAQRRHCHI